MDKLQEVKDFLSPLRDGVYDIVIQGKNCPHYHAFAEKDIATMVNGGMVNGFSFSVSEAVLQILSMCEITRIETFDGIPFCLRVFFKDGDDAESVSSILIRNQRP